jgi:small nuclear ribonucleoprotein D1
MSMNTHLKTVKMTLKGKNPISLDALSIRGKDHAALVLDPLGTNSFLSQHTHALFSSPLPCFLAAHSPLFFCRQQRAILHLARQSQLGRVAGGGGEEEEGGQGGTRGSGAWARAWAWSGPWWRRPWPGSLLIGANQTLVLPVPAAEQHPQLPVVCLPRSFF